MANSEQQQHIPQWAERERKGDLAWIRENLHVFWPVVQQAYAELGRGAVVVDTTSRPTGEGHPFGYYSQEMIEELGDGDMQRMVSEYDPGVEMVTVLLKSADKTSTYRVAVFTPVEPEEVLSEAPGGAESDLFLF